MSRQLPSQPNLEFLKKEAKELRAAKGCKLAEAQHAIAQEYGFSTWAKLKGHVQSLARERDPFQALTAAIADRDSDRVGDLLKRHAVLREKIDDPLPGYSFGVNALYGAVQRSDRETIDVLLRAGADINQRSDWWAGSFGVLDECSPEMADFLLARGARLDAHSAARLGRLDDLKVLVAADPEVVHARGGDGQTPLHFASTVEIAEFLLDHGADIDARDIDHESTAAQYMLRVTERRHYPRDRDDIARYLVSRGCRTDLLMAAALGDLELVQKHLDANPEHIRMTVSNEWFPKQNPRSGGTIYIWVLGWYRTPHMVARNFGHEDVFHSLMERTPPALKLALACRLRDEPLFAEILADRPDIIASLSSSDLQQLPQAAQDNNGVGVKLILSAGWPANARGRQNATALHWAGFHGNSEMVRDLLAHGADPELSDDDYHLTPIGWALYGSVNSWNCKTGDYAGAVRLLLEGGAVVPKESDVRDASEAVREVLRQHEKS